MTFGVNQRADGLRRGCSLSNAGLGRPDWAALPSIT